MFLQAQYKAESRRGYVAVNDKVFIFYNSFQGSRKQWQVIFAVLVFANLAFALNPAMCDSVTFGNANAVWRFHPNLAEIQSQCELHMVTFQL